MQMQTQRKRSQGDWSNYRSIAGGPRIIGPRLEVARLDEVMALETIDIQSTAPAEVTTMPKNPTTVNMIGMATI
jgi:hypothetical protein